jgi:glycosyltransferase 2 family protein
MKRIGAGAALLLGIGLMAWLLAQADWAGLRDALRSLSLPGFAIIISIYPLAIWLDALTWQPYLRSAKSTLRWTATLWRTQVVADAVMYITPLGVAGSEASKAIILNRRHSITYSDATASLIGLQLLLAIAQVPFLIIGVTVLIYKNVLPDDWRGGLVAATLAISLFMALIMMALHKRWLQHWPQKLGEHKLAAALERIEDQLSAIMHDKTRFLKTLLYAFANWVCFALEIWVIAWALGKPISFADAWAIETLVSLARAATFFIPGHIGAQDGATSFAFKLLYADPTFGLAVALVRRARELIWSLIALPLGLGDMRAVIKGQPF